MTLPRLSDVSFSTRSWHADSVHDSVAAAAAFNATRIDWFYPEAAVVPDWAGHVAALRNGSSKRWITAAINCGVSDTPALPVKGSNYTIGRAANIYGEPIKLPWLPNSWNLGCVNRPEYRALVNQRAYLMLKPGSLGGGGADGLQHDDAEANGIYATWSQRAGQRALHERGCFCDTCVAKFRARLNATLSAAALAALNISNISSFDYRARLRDEVARNTTSPSSARLEVLFAAFQANSAREYQQWLKSELGALARAWGAPRPPLSLNNGGALCTECEAPTDAAPLNVSDFGMGELILSRLGLNSSTINASEWLERELPVRFLELAASAAASAAAAGDAGRVSQIYTVPKSPYYADAEQLVSVCRRTIALGYASGGLVMAPWDIFMGAKAPRLFANASDFADLYSFVRDPRVSAVLDGFGNATRISARAAEGLVSFAGGAAPAAPPPIVLLRAPTAPGAAPPPRRWAVHAVSWRGSGVDRAGAAVHLSPSFFGAAASLTVAALLPEAGGAARTPLNRTPAGGFCCVPRPRPSAAGRPSNWLVLDVGAV